MTQDEFHDYVMDDALRGLMDRSSRKMFGGYGLYYEGRIFGLIADSTLYFKVDNTNRKQYEEAGSQPFVYEGRHNRGPVEMPYWSVPDFLLHDPSAIINWAQQSADLNGKEGPSMKIM